MPSVAVVCNNHYTKGYAYGQTYIEFLGIFRQIYIFQAILDLANPSPGDTSRHKYRLIYWDESVYSLASLFFTSSFSFYLFSWRD